MAIRQNHFTGVNKQNSIRLMFDGKELNVFNLSGYSKAIQAAESIVDSGQYEGVDVVEVTEQICLDCGEITVRTEQIHVTFTKE